MSGDGAPGPVAFLDTETITLRRGPDVVWEIGIILRDPIHDTAGSPAGVLDTEWSFQLRPNMSKADPVSLEIGRFDERFRVPDGLDAIGWSPAAYDEPAAMTHDGVVACLGFLLDGRHIVGAVPSFDTERLSLYGERHGWSRDPWHYHLADVENLAVGYLAGRWSHAIGLGLGGQDPALQPPWDSHQLSAAVGLEPPEESERHTALGDARWARDLYDAIMPPAGGPA